MVSMPENIRHSTFCIYGAGIVAASIYTAIKTLYHKTPLFFLISDFAGRGGTLGEEESRIRELDGIAVKTLTEWRKQMRIQDGVEKPDPSAADTFPASSSDIPDFYLIATPEIHHASIMDALLALNFLSINKSQILLITNKLENELMEKYYSSRQDCTTVHSLLAGRMGQGGRKNGTRQQTQNDESQRTQYDGMRLPIQVFQVKSHMDKPLHHKAEVPETLERRQDTLENRHYQYLYPIQAGAALASQTVADIRDDTGDNISVKNGNYCELTATYHAWKNSNATYKGICHYRRIFDINTEQMQMLLTMETEWDVILPYPSIYYPNLAGEHARYVRESDWDAMLRALEEVAPEYFEAYKELVAKGVRFFYNFNMLIAKAPIFDEYCEFLFKVLERTEEYIVPKEQERADRYAGYLGENLTTIFYLKNRSRLKCIYAGKILLT